MAWEWVGSVATGVTGIAGIAGALLIASRQDKVQVRIARDERDHQLAVQRLADRRELYAKFLAGTRKMEESLLPAQKEMSTAGEDSALSKVIETRAAMHELMLLHQEVMLVSGEKVSRLSARVWDYYAHCYSEILLGKEYSELRSDNPIYELVRAMQAELNVKPAA